MLKIRRHAVAACSAAVAASALVSGARAHAIAGARVFPVTLTLDDPGVADELTAPQVTYQRSGADGGPGSVQEGDIEFEYDKRITQDFGLGINDGVVIQGTEHDKTRTGAENIELTAKYQVLINAPHELIFTVGVSREFGRTGTIHTGGDQYGSTAPTVYFGKGLGDLQNDTLRPFAVTGEFSYTIADRALKQIPPPLAAPAPGVGMAEAVFNNGNNNAWAGGVSLQYSIPYLVSQVHDFNGPSFLKHLVPVVELTWSSPASSPSSDGTQIVVAPGFIWIDRSMQIGLEALIPANKASGTNVGVVGQVHFFLDDLLPHSLGKPIAEW